MRIHPPPRRKVGDRHAVPDQVARGRLGQLRLHDAVQPLRLPLVAVDAVLDLLGRVPEEVVGLPLHGAQAAHLPHQLYLFSLRFLSIFQ